jgi:hypothetical protein
VKKVTLENISETILGGVNTYGKHHAAFPLQPILKAANHLSDLPLLRVPGGAAAAGIQRVGVQPLRIAEVTLQEAGQVDGHEGDAETAHEGKEDPQRHVLNRGQNDWLLGHAAWLRLDGGI